MPRPDRDPIEGRLVDGGPEPSHYVPQMTRTRKFVVWFFRSPAFIWVALLLIAIPVLIWRLPALLFVAGLIVGWYGGWLTAKSIIKTDGELPPL